MINFLYLPKLKISGFFISVSHVLSFAAFTFEKNEKNEIQSMVLHGF